MKRLEVFFDYNCPYCLKGHEQLLKFVGGRPGLEIVWCPCEISVYKGQVSGGDDVSLRGMFFALDSGVDLWAYHQRAYDFIFKDRAYTGDADGFAKAMEGVLDAEALRLALRDGKYVDRLKASNRFAFTETGVHVVPTYRADGGVLQDRQEFYGMGHSDTSYHGKK